jgi:glycosyltransferase involved in cell wall biosynthesis
MARRLAKKHSVTVFTRRYKKLPLQEEREGFVVKRFRILNLPVLSFLSHMLSSLLTIRMSRPDVLQCMMLTPNGLVGVLASKLFGIKFVPWVRGGDWYLTRGSFLGRSIISYVIRNSPLILVQTEKIRKDILKEFPGKEIEVIPNGVEIKGEKSSGDRIVYIGNLSERKGVEYLIEAMRGVDAELLVVGDGPKRRILESIAGDNVTFVGRVSHDEVGDYLKKAMIFVLPAKKGEGLPNVILEAMSFGVPVVSTNIAGISDVVKHGKTGFLVNPGDSDGLRKHIKKLLDDEKLRREMSSNCSMEIRKYSWENMIRMLNNVYRKGVPVL